MKRTIFAAFAIAILPSLVLAQQRGESMKGKYGLTHDQVHALQQALTDDGCYDGAVDGRIGPKTRAALACSRRKHDLDGNNANELFRALNLDFTIADSTGMGGIMRMGNRRPERRRDRSIEDTSSNRGRGDMRDGPETRRNPDELRMPKGDTIGLENKGKVKPKKPVKP